MSKNTMSLVAKSTRTVQRKGANPFAPLAQAKNNQLFQNTNIYETLSKRATPLIKQKNILAAVEKLSERLAGGVYTQEHFGTLMTLDVSLIDCNINIQRFLEIPHIGNII